MNCDTLAVLHTLCHISVILHNVGTAGRLWIRPTR